MVRGHAPESRKKKAYTLKEFIDKEYASWRHANRKRAHEDLYRIKARFENEFGHEMLSSIVPLQVDRWRSKRVMNGIKSVTVNRDIAILKAVLSKAEEWGFIVTSPLSKFKPAHVDSIVKVRYLTQHEYGDHLTPMVLLSLNTGLRRGELFALRWEDVNFEQAILTINGDTAKSGKTRHIPLNIVAQNILKCWQEQTSAQGLVFHSYNGDPFNNVKTSWTGLLKASGIKNFRWHDMRHHFASRLVMSGVDLNTVRELLGHADIKMTLRYAHLAPEHKAKAVAKLLEHY